MILNKSTLLITSLIAFLSVLAAASATQCKNPKGIEKAKYFTTTQAQIVAKIGKISEFPLECTPHQDKVTLFAEVNGRIAPVVRVGDDRYQVSWIEDIKDASSGYTAIRVFDEEGYATYRKAQRSGESTGNVAALGTSSLYHPGAYKGAFINSELLATVLITGAAFVAFSTRNKLVS